jgi:hypothetical protein
MNIDFNTLETGEDLSKDSHSAVEAQEFAEANKKYRILCKKYNRTLIAPPMVSRDAVNPVTSEQYNARLYVVSHIIRNPELTDVRYPVRDTWNTMYPHIPYPDKITSIPWSKAHKIKLKDLMKEQGVWKHVEFSKTRHYIERVSSHYKDTKLANLEREISKLQEYVMVLDKDSKDIWYKGHVIKRTSRELRTEVNGVKMTVPLKAIDKLFEIFDQIG